MIPPYTAALVVGLGASGLAAARLLQALDVEVRAYDRQPRRLDELDLSSETRLFTGLPMPPKDAWLGIDLLVLSPGVPPGPFLEQHAALAPNARIHGELGLGLSLLRPPPRTILITGTNGKSTVTALTGALLAASGRDPFVGGNLGDPLCARVQASLIDGEPWPTDLVLECSSYQLETLPVLPTAVGMVLNVTPDHLDRYPSMQAYAETKARVFAGLQAGGLALLDAENEWTEHITPDRPELRVVQVGTPEAEVVGEGAGRELCIEGDPPYPRDLLRLPARHNARNALFALLAARHLGVSAEQCREGLASFEGLPHRMRLVRELDGVRWYNDSKATNVASAIAGLGGMQERFVLIAGGQGKGDDLEPLRRLLAERGRGLVAIGTAAPQFLALADQIPAEHAKDMAAAVASARTMARPGDVVVLAPACASFDQYRSYAHRGEVFEAAVQALN